MPVLSEKRVLWHPRAESNKFVVGGASHIALYELSSDGQPEIKHLNSQHDLQFMKCFAWSPAKISSDIFAVGHSSGSVDLLRLEASQYSQLDPDDHVISSRPILSLPVRNQRSCNALAFCPSDPKYLAVGLDKVRGDGSLVIWDVQEETGAFRAAVTDEATSTEFINNPPIPRSDFPARTDPRIVQAHATTELISSLAWLPQPAHPYLLLAGISQRWLRIFDLRTPAGSGAGASYVSSVAAKVTGITTDPFDATRFASWGDGVITLWDTRKLHTSRIQSNPTDGAPSPTPLLIFTENETDGASSTLGTLSSKTSASSKARGSTSTSASNNPNTSVTQQPAYLTVEFSPTRRGLLASLAKDAAYVRLWDVLEAGNSSIQHEADNTDESITKPKDRIPVNKKSWANLPWSGSNASSNESKTSSPVREEESPEQSQHPALILYNSRRAFSRNPLSALCSFAIIPPIYPSHRTRTKMVVVTQTGEIAVQSAYDAPQTLAWSSRGDMFYGPLESSTQEREIAGFGVLSSCPAIDYPEEEINNPLRSDRALRTARSQSISKSHATSDPQEFLERGRTRNPSQFEDSSPLPLFGRGDAEGFPALSKPASMTPPANLAATKPMHGVTHEDKEKRRTFSPAAALRVPLHPTIAPTSASTVSEKLQGGSSTPSKAPSTTLIVGQRRPIGDKRISPINVTNIAHTAAGDISMVMRRRATQGYSIRDPLLNASIVREHALSAHHRSATAEFGEVGGFQSTDPMMLADLWEWIYRSQNFLSSPTPLLHGYDFSFAGVWGIWDGPPSVGGSGVIPRYMDPDPHFLHQSNPFATDIFDRHPTTSGSSASGSVSSSLNTGSISSSPRSSLGFGPVAEDLGDAEATPVHRDRLELPQVLETPLIHSFDRSRRGQGQNIISGSRRTKTRSPHPDPLAKDPEWHEALLNLFARTSGSSTTSTDFPYVSTSRPLQRRICLHLIGWGFILRDESLMTEVRRWEQEREGDEGYARAAAWLVFSNRYGGGAGVGLVHGEGAIECLLRSEDETHHMMSGVIAALVPFASGTPTSSGSSSKLTLSSALREHYARLINKLHDPYLRSLLTHMTAISSTDAPSGEHWLEILHDEADLLPFHERLALAFCFLEDAALTTYLRRCREHALSKSGGDVDALVVTGLGSPEGREVLARWLDRWGDIQSAALLGWAGVSVGLPTTTEPPSGSKAGEKLLAIDLRVSRWVEAYRDFLDSLKLFHCRVDFDIERGQTLKTAFERSTIMTSLGNLAPKQILIRCNYCNKTITPSTQPSDLGLGLDSLSKGKPTACPNCARALPRCSVCLMTLGIVQDTFREAELSQSRRRDTIDDAIVICQKSNCRHGGHASHILQWFFGDGEGDGQASVSHKTCAVADCDCQCGNEF